MVIQQDATGSKKRRYKRSYKIYRVQYGPKGTEHKAFARRLSETGLFIDANRDVYAAGSPLIMHIEIEGTIYSASGLVRNARTSDARLIRILKPGMGVEFTSISQDLKNILTKGH
jgi:hypothetical protein